MESLHARISVRVQPSAPRNEVTGFLDDVWRIKVAAPPVQGRANAELVEFLSDILGVSKSSVTVWKGHTSHNKVIDIIGLSHQEVVNRLSRVLGGTA